MRCPWPVLRLARAIREGATEVHLLADDPRALPDTRTLAGERGWHVAEEGGAIVVRVADAT